ncbi:MAG: type 1 glutamine amidotransferase [Alphaproteobacteria bacterium]|jgi:GMP synthase-like glutamine amidotransferase|nr:type 1 glutamine amidotransferase [Alphaproteobacteria bacterium]
MNFLSLQHIAIEDPGYIKDLLLADGHNLTTIELDEGEKIPTNLDSFDVMFSMGGPMDTWMEDEHPWLIDEKKAIQKFVLEMKKPFIGFCLGCQLLGEVLGGRVVKSNPPEIGILDINLTDKAKSDPLFLNFPNTFKALQWHSYEVQGLENNEDIHILGSSVPTKFQIFNYKNYAYGIQFHIEIKNDTVSNWGNVPEYKQALEDSLGEGSLDTMKIESDLHLKQMNDLSSSLYKNIINNFK